MKGPGAIIVIVNYVCDAEGSATIVCIYDIDGKEIEGCTDVVTNGSIEGG